MPRNNELSPKRNVTPVSRVALLAAGALLLSGCDTDETPRSKTEAPAQAVASACSSPQESGRSTSNASWWVGEAGIDLFIEPGMSGDEQKITGYVVDHLNEVRATGGTDVSFYVEMPYPEQANAKKAQARSEQFATAVGTNVATLGIAMMPEARILPYKPRADGYIPLPGIYVDHTKPPESSAVCAG